MIGVNSLVIYCFKKIFLIGDKENATYDFEFDLKTKELLK